MPLCGDAIQQKGIGIEAASIGREGAVGLHRGLGKRRSFTRAVIQVSGTISHISADVFERAVGQSDAIKDVITHYTEVLWVEAQQIAACNAVHSAEARFARWLLQVQDRIDSPLLPLRWGSSGAVDGALSMAALVHLVSKRRS
jgi:hypothetical protein